MDNENYRIIVLSDDSESILQAKQFASINSLLYQDELGEEVLDYSLNFSSEKKYLSVYNNKKAKTKIYVDFVSGASKHRRKYGGGKSQAIAKAVGLNKSFKPTVLDVTAGLGGDAFVLACLGCKLTLLERSPIAHLLLADGIDRALNINDVGDDDVSEIINRMELIYGDSIEALKSENIPKHDVVYVDPMFPERKKSAAVKKEMRAFHSIIGSDTDADELLDLALSKAIYRVVVKRPRIAPHLAGKEPSYQLEGKSSRFDIYTLKAMTISS